MRLSPLFSVLSVLLAVPTVTFAFTEKEEATIRQEMLRTLSMSGEGITCISAFKDTLPKPLTDDEMKTIFGAHLQKVDAWTEVAKIYARTAGDVNARYYQQAERTLLTKYPEAVGIAFVRKSDGVYVLSTKAKSAAEKANVLKGDRIISIDYEPVKSKTNTQIDLLLRGPVHSTIQLEVERKGVVKTLKFKREIPTAEFSLSSQDGFAIARPYEFGEANPTYRYQFEMALERSSKGMIIDLRGHPGGRVDTLQYEVAESLVKKGAEIGSVTFMNGKQCFFRTIDEPIVPKEVPIVVIVDGKTAAGGEMLAHTLANRANTTIIGQQTANFDKIDTYNTFDDQSFLRVTVGTLHPPGYLQKKQKTLSLKPDIRLSNTMLKGDKAIKEAIRILQKETR